MTKVVRPQILDDIESLGDIFKDMEIGYSEVDYSDGLAEFLPVLRGDHQEMFSGEHDSSGAQWAPLAQSTINRKGHERILFESGHLQSSLVQKGGADHLENVNHRELIFGTEDEKAGLHQSGKGRMPARPPVGLKEKTLDKIVDSVADLTIGSLWG